MEHKDEEYDDFESLLERQAGAGDTTWKESSEKELQSSEVIPADDAVHSSASDTKSDVTPEQVKRVESVSAFDAASELSDFTDAELELIRASQSPTAESNPELLSELLDAKRADERIQRHTITKIQLTPDSVSTNGDGTQRVNPGWKITAFNITSKTAKELNLEEELAETYRRETYNIDQLETLEEICEVADKTALDIQFMIRRLNAA